MMLLPAYFPAAVPEVKYLKPRANAITEGVRIDLPRTSAVTVKYVPSEAVQLQAHRAISDLKCLTEIMLADDEYDEDFLRPTPEAFSAAWEMVHEAYMSCPDAPSRLRATPTGGGGLALRWLNREREVAFTISPLGLGDSHLYLRDGRNDDLIREVTGSALAERLSWLSLG